MFIVPYCQYSTQMLIADVSSSCSQHYLPTPSFEITAVDCLWFFKLSLQSQRFPHRLHCAFVFALKSPQLLSESLLSKNHLFSSSSIHKSVMSWMGLFLHFKSPSHSKASEQMLPNMQPNSCLRVYDTKHQQWICWLHIETFCDYCGRREISDPASPLPEPQIGAANISSSMKAAFPEFFRIYVYCYSARNDKRMRGEKGIAGQSWKTDIFYSFKIFPNKEHWRRRKEVFWNLYQ